MKWWTAILGPSKKPAFAWAAAAGLAVSLVADEPVHFSDSTANPGAQQKKVRTESGPGLDSLIGRGGPSLEALTAPPFRPVDTATPRVLTPKEQERLSRERNWMFRDPADSGVSDKAAREAFGVRSQDWKSTPETKREPVGSISRYVETSRAAGSAATEAAVLNRNTTQAAKPGGPMGTGPSSMRSIDQPPDFEPMMTASKRSDRENSWLQRFRRVTGAGLGSKGMEALGELSSSSLQSGVGDSRDPLTSLRNPLAENINRLRGMTDSLSAFPDKTKEALDPVVAGGPLAGAPRTSLGTVPNELAIRVGTIRGGVGNGLNASGISAASDNPGQLSAPQPSQIQTTPLVLDTARRHF